MEGAADQEIDLTLGLSTNGRFGVDPTRKRPRDTLATSSPASFGGVLVNGESSRAGGLPPLARMRPLPGETNQWSRRMGAQPLPPRLCVHESCRRKWLERCTWLANHGGLNVRRSTGNGNVFWNGVFVPPLSQGPIGALRIGSPGNNHALYRRQMGVPSSQGSIGTRSTGSAGNYGLNRQQMQGGNRNAATTLQLQRMREATLQRLATARSVLEAGGNELYGNALLNMPFVSTRLHGPNTRKVDGFLYECSTGEETTTKIVCVCHGYCLTPAEFVRHGGGGDVDNPLRQIVVQPFNLR